MLKVIISYWAKRDRRNKSKFDRGQPGIDACRQFFVFNQNFSHIIIRESGMKRLLSLWREKVGTFVPRS